MKEILDHNKGRHEPILHDQTDPTKAKLSQKKEERFRMGKGNDRRREHKQ